MTKELISPGQHEMTRRPGTFWSNIHKMEDGPILVAAERLRKKGFGITLREAVDSNGKPLPSYYYASVYTATEEDRRALGLLIGADELKTLRLYAAANFSRGPYLMPRVLPISNKDMAFHVDQAIERLGLMPGQPGLMGRLRRKLTGKL